MDTLSFSFLTDADDSLDTARTQFGRREFPQALDTIARMPALLSRRADVLELKAKALQAVDKHLDAVAAWEELVRVEPENKAARTQLSNCYAKLGIEEVFKDVLVKFRTRKFADALELLETGPASWRNLAEFHRLKATMHERLGQHELALQSWRKLEEVAPGHVEACQQIPVCLVALGRIEEAGNGFRRAAEKHPASLVAQFNLLFFDVKQKGIAYIPIALLEIERIRAATANFTDFKRQLDLFRERLLSLHDPEALGRLDRENALALASAVADHGESMRSVYEQFEPVGNNCEFGDAQRKHGAEPLALFRWTSIAPENLARLLGDGLEGFDDPKHYRLDVAPEGEYLLKEDVYGTASHTRVKVADVSSPEALLAQLARRQSFLKRKLLETLEEGRKIFVFKADRILEPELLDLVETRLRGLGAGKVLFVMPQDEAHPGGSTEIVSPTRVVGRLSAFMPDTQFAQWDAIVKRAHAHFNAREVKPGAA